MEKTICMQPTSHYFSHTLNSGGIESQMFSYKMISIILVPNCIVEELEFKCLVKGKVLKNPFNFGLSALWSYNFKSIQIGLEIFYMFKLLQIGDRHFYFLT